MPSALQKENFRRKTSEVFLFFHYESYRTKGIDIEIQSTTYWKEIREFPLLLPFLRP